MIVESIRLDNFRNYNRLELHPDPGINVFYGKNAQGKTNILESIYLCGTTRSHRQAKDRDMIRFGEEECHIRMKLLRGNVPCRIDIHLKKTRAKGAAVNGVPVRKASEILGLGYFVFFSPEDLNIIKNGPSDRRRFLDMQLCQLSPSYISNLNRYQKVLMQRNRLLKDISFHPEYLPTLDVWDEQMVSYGSKVILEREKFLSKISRQTQKIHSALTGGRENLLLSYEKNINADNFAAELARGRERDLKMKMSMIGPHRDDLLFQIYLPDPGDHDSDHNAGTADLRRFGSQGQQRTAALSLKLAEIEMVREKVNDTPVLLLDDVLSELDGERQKFLLSQISDIQTMITCTGLEDFLENQFQIDRMFHVQDGTVK